MRGWGTKKPITKRLSKNCQTFVFIMITDVDDDDDDNIDDCWESKSYQFIVIKLNIANSKPMKIYRFTIDFKNQQQLFRSDRLPNSKSIDFILLLFESFVHWFMLVSLLYKSFRFVWFNGLRVSVCLYLTNTLNFVEFI